jgi:hypothetical protein
LIGSNHSRAWQLLAMSVLVLVHLFLRHGFSRGRSRQRRAKTGHSNNQILRVQNLHLPCRLHRRLKKLESITERFQWIAKCSGVEDWIANCSWRVDSSGGNPQDKAGFTVNWTLPKAAQDEL